MAKETTKVMNASDDLHCAGGRDPAFVYIAGVVTEVVRTQERTQIQFLKYEVIGRFNVDGGSHTSAVASQV